MAKSPVPAFPLRDSTFHIDCARKATAFKLKRLGRYLLLDHARRLLRTESRFDWLTIVLIVLAVAGHAAANLGLPYAALLEWVALSFAAIGSVALMGGYGAQKLGLIDLAFFRDKSSRGKAEAGDAIYIHQKPEMPIAESVRSSQVTAEVHPKPAAESAEGRAKTPDWQTVEFKNLGKIRYRLPVLQADRDQPDKNKADE